MQSKFGTVIGYIFAFSIVFGIPSYFLWNYIIRLFHSFPSNQREFIRLFELEHGIIFYIFVSIILMYIIFRALMVTLLLLESLAQEYSSGAKALYLALYLLLILSFALPIVSYFIIGNNLYSSFEFSFIQMFSYVGVFEFYMLGVVIFESFILDVPIISFFTRMGMYGYLLYIFG